ncbi:MAG: M56 family metallopeptidase, partial [Planctomycetota bacterium]
MDNLITFLNTMGKTFIDFSMPMLIQSSVLIIILLIVDLLVRKKVRAVFRYCIWMLVLVKLVLPTTLSSPTGLGYWFGDKFEFANAEVTEPVEPIEKVPWIHKKVEHEIPVQPALSGKLDVAGNEIKSAEWPRTFVEPQIDPVPINSDAAASPVTVSLSWQGFAFLGWVAAVMAMVLLLIQRMFFVRGLLAQSKTPSGSMTCAFQQCQQQIKIRGKINLKLSPVAASPSVCGLVRPTILIPENLPSKLKAEDLRSILLHELAHIKRGDLWVSLVQTILQIAYFYNPLLWVANAVIRKVREQAVDEMVLVAMGEDADDYPETLLNISRLTFSRPVLSLRLIGVVESKKALSSRIKHILNRPFPKTAKLGIVGLLVIIITAAILLPMAKGAKQPEFIIKGTVTDAETGQPITGAKVGDNKEYSDKFYTFTDSNGHYEYKTWYEEHFTKCEAVGYKTEKKILLTKIFGSEKEEVIDFALVPTTVVTIEQVMKRADSEARLLNHEYIGTEHILMVLASEKSGKVAEIFAASGIDEEKIHGELMKCVKKGIEPVAKKKLSQTPRT